MVKNGYQLQDWGLLMKKENKSVHYSGRRSKQRIQGQRIIFEGKGPKGWNKNILLFILFSILTRKPKVISHNLIY